ncbi:leucine-rich repeat domain-containing protein [Stygiobacter electus]|uniref:Leucine-rich repeat domain-containing protein n=1 Tax=Stygiobacter electus TaxID=3032292 RepID=A0AAE3TD81_9BACT|nr:leucine-rich repeat domain-containing protein [Stygiobacter electus]MDF1612690.1 leucine-rich repeat domain-containing protein [Stygiobacter electus]
MKKIIITFSVCSLLFSCDHIIDNKETKIGANAGEDQITFVGSYALLDISKSIINEPIDLIEWIQDATNPQEVNLFAQSSLNDKWVVGFEKEGIYKFTLSIKCKSGNIFTDSVMVMVKSRQRSLIEDICLEARIRYRLNFSEGELNAAKLLMLDTLSYAEFYLKNYKIKSIKGIENCTNLIYLSLPNESITDLTSLSALIKLEYLDLNQNRTVEDISPLSNLINLKTLILYSNPIKNISTLANLTKLKELCYWVLPLLILVL